MDTMSASPRASSASATSGMLMRLLVITGTVTTSRSRRVAQLKAARGTMVATVGTRASCQPMPVLSKETPAACKASANARVSSQWLPCATKSSSEMRKMMRKSLPTTSRTRCTIANAKRCLASALPPQWSVRWLVCGARNWLIR